MSRKSQLNTLKKEELVGNVLNLETKIEELSDKVDAGLVKQDVKSSVESASMQELLEQNRMLRDELDRKKETDKFVFVECQSKGRVWLASPESRSGDPKDREKGRMLKGDKDFAVIPAYWMLDFIAHRIDALRDGEIVINNSRGRALNPNVEFVDFDLPDDFLASAIKTVDIEKIVRKADNSIYDFIKAHKAERPILGRTKGIVDSFTAKEESKKEESQDESLISFFTSVSLHIDELLSPNREAEYAEKKREQELLLKTV